MTILSVALPVAGGAWLIFPVAELVARAEGHVIVVDEPVRRVAVAAGGRTTTVFRFTNVSAHVVNVVGVETLCGCTSVHPMPVAIPALESADLTVSFNMEGHAPGTEYHWDPRFFVDCPSPEVRVIVDLELQ